MVNTDDELKDIWEVEKELLDVLDDICSKYELKYSLAFGSMIGAVRHKGFIPWDDDIDVFMPRTDYEKLIEIWDSIEPEGYILQNKRLDNTYIQNFTKIRKDHTAFIMSEREKSVKYHTGIFIDIFPGDRIPTNKYSQKLQKALCALNLLYSREFTSGAKGIVGVAEKLLLSVPHKFRVMIFNLTERKIQKWNHFNTEFIFPSTAEWLTKKYPADMFEGLIRMPFDDRYYYCSKDYDVILKNDYGDYMQYPPIEQRVLKHHPVYVDFCNNYEER